MTATPTFPRPLVWVHALVLLTIVAAVYGPDAGRGFVKDDFRWIVASRVRTAGDLKRLFVDTTGFYRPMVSLSFAANERLGGANPMGYGLTNLALEAHLVQDLLERAGIPSRIDGEYLQGAAGGLPLGGLVKVRGPPERAAAFRSRWGRGSRPAGRFRERRHRAVPK